MKDGYIEVPLYQILFANFLYFANDSPIFLPRCFFLASGVSEDGEDADLSDALKDSPTSPFEESEPEMLTTSRYPRHAELAPSADVMETPHETPSEMRLSSGPQTESEPEMIPTPPSVGEVRLMTSSQVSSSISQR